MNKYINKIKSSIIGWLFTRLFLMGLQLQVPRTKQSRISTKVLQQGAGQSDGKGSVEVTDTVLGFQTSLARPFGSNSMKLETHIHLNYAA